MDIERVLQVVLQPMAAVELPPRRTATDGGHRLGAFQSSSLV